MRRRSHEPGGWAHALTVAGAAPRCGARRPAPGARRKRTFERCRASAMPNGRCHKHGGASTGPRSAEGMARLRRVPLRHGRRGAEARQAARDRSEARKVLAALNCLLRGM